MQSRNVADRAHARDGVTNHGALWWVARRAAVGADRHLRLDRTLGRERDEHQPVSRSAPTLRGAAIPLFVWATLLAVLLTVNAIWTGRWMQVAMLGFAAVVVCVGAMLLRLHSRESLRRGAPEWEDTVETIPEISLSAALVAVSLAAILFGVVGLVFFVYVGAGLLLLSLGALTVELRSERRSRVAASRSRRRKSGASRGAREPLSGPPVGRRRLPRSC